MDLQVDVQASAPVEADRPVVADSRAATGAPAGPDAEPPRLDPALRKRRHVRNGDAITRMTVPLEFVTPVLGGAARTREIDEVDIVRVPTIRGHLRFWWRALYAQQWPDPAKLAEAEGKLWGHAAGNEGGRTLVVIAVSVDRDRAGRVTGPEENVEPRTPGSYALWPARAQSRGEPPAPRRMPGTRFTLTVDCPENHEPEVRNALRAWILFGGYGSRTRRGLGTVTVAGDKAAGEERTNAVRAAWLPAAPAGETGAGLFAGLATLFGEPILDRVEGRQQDDLPTLRGAALVVGSPVKDAEVAWITALGWLNTFRQGTGGSSPARAPDPTGGSRPSISNWPEADKVRRLSTPQDGLPWAHHPRPQYTNAPVWPRASFGLPVIGQFQRGSRKFRVPRGEKESKYLRWGELPPTDSNYGAEPPDFELNWTSGEPHDRLASPLIVKALPLADGRYLPCALWLERAYPAGQVVLRQHNSEVPGSGAAFDVLLAPGDSALFAPLGAVVADVPAGRRMRTAFMSWLVHSLRLAEVSR